MCSVLSKSQLAAVTQLSEGFRSSHICLPCLKIHKNIEAQIFGADRKLNAGTAFSAKSEVCKVF